MTRYHYPAVPAGKKLTAAYINSFRPQYIEKVNSTDRTSTTVLADDPDLTVAVVSGGLYLIEFGLYYDGLSAADFKTAWNTPGGSSGLKNVLGPGSASGDDANANNILGRFGVHGLTTSISYNCSRNSTSQQLAYESSVVTAGANGNVTIQWAQVTSNVTATTVGGSSWARAARIA